MSSLVLVTAGILISQAKAVTTLGQEEDIFSRIWSHPSENSKSRKLDFTKRGENQFAKETKDLGSQQKKRLSDKRLEETLKILHNRDLVGARLH
jgi:hypothetical protein